MNKRLISIGAGRLAGHLRLLALVVLIVVPALARSTGAPPGRTGAPPGDNCTGCHLGTLNSGAGNLKIEFAGGSSYVPGQTYKVRVTLADPAAQRWGFELTGRVGADKLAKGGNFSIDDSSRTQFSPGSTPGEYVTHTSAGTSPGTSGSSSWEANWTAPLAGTGPVTFYAAGNAANNNGANTGDLIYTTSLQISEAGTTVTGETYILPFLAYGGGWYSALYLANTTDAPATVAVQFYRDDGADLSVPLTGIGPVSNYTVSIPARGAINLEAPNSGGLQRGWAKATLPTGVTGYGLFRQSVSGRADQEAVVPFSEDSRLVGYMVWDDMLFTTSMSVLNPEDTPAVATLAVFAGNGAQIGTVTLNLPGRSLQAFNLREQPGLAGVTGKLGSLRLSVPAGSVAALGLRFGDTAITSIPVEQP